MFRVVSASSTIARVSASRVSFSTQVSASMVKELREKSGAPMMDCKKALAAEGVNGDIKLAMDWLRAKGIARAASNADRVTMEGLIAVSKHDNGAVTLLEVNSETGTLLDHDVRINCIFKTECKLIQISLA
jgi:elongation factor Ts